MPRLIHLYASPGETMLLRVAETEGRIFMSDKPCPGIRVGDLVTFPCWQGVIVYLGTDAYGNHVGLGSFDDGSVTARSTNVINGYYYNPPIAAFRDAHG